MNLGLPWWIGAGEASEGIQRAAELGFDFLELSLDTPWPGELSPVRLADRADEAGVALGMHAPWRTQALAHPRQPLAQAAREVAQECLAAARAAEADYIVFHADARAFSTFPRRDVVHRGLEAAQASLTALSRSADGEVEVLLENTSPPLGTPEGVADFLDPVPDVGFCLDPGHAAIVARRDEEAGGWDPAAWTGALGDRLSLLHLMDMVETEAGVRDHLLPGSGEADLAAIVDQARKAGCSRVLLEAFYARPGGEEPTDDEWTQAAELVASL